MFLNHGDRVLYRGHTDNDLGVKTGHVYTVFGCYPPTPMKGAKTRDEIKIRVDDPLDYCGGVVALPARDFVEIPK